MAKMLKRRISTCCKRKRVKSNSVISRRNRNRMAASISSLLEITSFMLLIVVGLMQPYYHVAAAAADAAVSSTHRNDYNRGSSYKKYIYTHNHVNRVESSTKDYEVISNEMDIKSQPRTAESTNTTALLAAAVIYNHRSLQSTTVLPMKGTCTSNILDSGKQITSSSYLCYPSSNNNSNNNNSAKYLFGINSNNQIALYTQISSTYHLLWTATPPMTTLSRDGVHVLRMQGQLGSLAGYNSNRQKIYDSHDHEGIYSTFALENGVNGDEGNVQSGKVRGSRLILDEEGVRIVTAQNVVTFQILVPTSYSSIGNNNKGSVQGFVWDDGATNDGRFGAGDSAVGVEVDVALLECDTDKVVKSGKSGSDGMFEFGGLVQGRYKVHVSTPEEYVFVEEGVNNNGGGGGAASGRDSDVDKDGFSNCLVVSGGQLTHLVYVGVVKEVRNADAISVAGKVFYDHDGDGLFGDVPSSTALIPVGNIIVDLYDCVNPDKWIAVTRTDASGNYKFTTSDSSSDSTTTDISSLLEQEGITQFRAMFSGLPNGFTFSPKSKDSYVTSVDGSTSCYNVENGGGAIVWNAGIKPPPTKPPTMKPTLAPTAKVTEALVTIGGYAFLDLDDNGMRGPDLQEEVAIADVNVRLFSGCNPSNTGNGAGTFFSSARTDADGLYKFANVPAGSYKMLATVPDNFVLSSTWSDLGANVDSAFNPDTGSTKCFVLEDGKTDLSWGLGLRDTTPVVISGVVFEDVNNNGVFDTEEESPMRDVNVALFDCEGNIQLLDTTDANGMYGFSDLTAGSYLLKISAPDDYQVSSVWSGLIDNEGKLAVPDADNNVDPQTGNSVCKAYKAGDEDYSLDAGLISSNDFAVATEADATPAESKPATPSTTTKPTTKPTDDLSKGDGTPCSGGKCEVEGMCRNKAGLCGIGLAFCNADSVWIKTCPEDDNSLPSVAPELEDDSALTPTKKPTVSEPTTSAVGKSYCNDDGSVGDVSGVNAETATIQFEYSIESDAFSSSSTDTLVDLFEKELNRLVACEFANDPCLKCESSNMRVLRNIEDSTIIGLSPSPKDEITLRQCNIPSPKCKMMQGVMTAYYPQGTTASVLENEEKQLLASIDNVIDTHDWVGMKVSVEDKTQSQNPAPVTSPDPPPSSGGLSAGAITGIMVAVLSVFAVVAVGVIRIRRIRAEEDEIYFKHMQEQMHDSGIPFGDDDDDEEDDSDDSSYDSYDSSSHPSRSAISGETFPTNIAQAMPQDIENSDSSSESGSSESEDDVEEVDEEGVEIDDLEMNGEGVEQLKYLEGSDSAPSIYENSERMDSEELAAAAEFEGDHRNSSYPYQNMSNRHSYDDNAVADDTISTGSVNSADPPGQSYRDLPEDWEPALPPPALDYGQDDDQFPTGKPNFPAYDYDNDLSDGGSEASNQGSYRSGRSNRSYHSNRSHRSSRSNHSQKSDRSYQSHHSRRSQESQQSQGSHRSGRSAGSHYSRHSNPDQQEANGNTSSYNRSDLNGSYHSQNSHHSNHSGGSSPDRFHENINQYGADDQQFAIRRPREEQQNGNSNSFQHPQSRYDDEQYMNDQGQAYAAANNPQYGRFNDGRFSSPPQRAAYGGGEFDEASYHSFDPVPQTTHQYHPRSVDDHVDDVSTYTTDTRKASNVTYPDEQEDYEVDDDEESISEIFKSLSEIQTKLAKKGGRSKSKKKASSSQSQQQQRGWDQEGVVEDVSVDGSQFPSMPGNQYRNRRPQHGQWMEPVNENGYT